MTEEQELRQSFAPYLKAPNRELDYTPDPLWHELSQAIGGRRRRHYGAWGLSLAGLAAIAALAPVLVTRHPQSANPRRSPFVLPASHLRALAMTSMTTGWALDRAGTLYRTHDAGRHWRVVTDTRPRGLNMPLIGISARGQDVAWGVSKGSSRHQLVLWGTNDGGRNWSHQTVSLPWVPLSFNWSPALRGPTVGLLAIGRISKTKIGEAVWTFNMTSHHLSLLDQANPATSHEPILTGLTVLSAKSAWGVSNASGPDPSLWQLAGGKAHPVALPLPHGLAKHDAATMTPAPTGGPEFPTATDGFLGTNYDTLSLRPIGTPVTQAILYRSLHGSWIPVWHRAGHLSGTIFVTPSVGWIWWTPKDQATPELLKTSNGGKSFQRMSAPGKGHPTFVSQHDGWWIDTTGTTVRLWTTKNGGRSWQRLSTRYKASR